MAKISNIVSHEILDSRGNPTIKTDVWLDDGAVGEASVPSGASTGSHEAIELRDHDEKRYDGMGVLKAIENIHTKIKPVLIGKEGANQKAVDDLMISLDGTDNKSKLGANAILSVSMAVARACAHGQKKHLFEYLRDIYSLQNKKIPKVKYVKSMFNLINGGLHGGNKLSVQEFMIVPSEKYSYNESLQIGAEIYHTLKKIIREKGLSVGLGDEGGFTPNFKTNEEAIDVLVESIERAGYKLNRDIWISLDMAASEYYENGSYRYFDKLVEKQDYIFRLLELNNKYNFLSLEDPLFEDDWDSWTSLTKTIGSTTLTVGDDLLCTNARRLQIAIDKKACTAVLVKLNQIGTLSETLTVVQKSQEAGLKVIISHRSGETNDDFISDLAVAVGAEFVKFGAPARGERVIKYNRLSWIYSQL